MITHGHTWSHMVTQVTQVTHDHTGHNQLGQLTWETEALKVEQLAEMSPKTLKNLDRNNAVTR